MKKLLILACLISAPLWAQDRAGIKGVVLGQTLAQLPAELAATCRPNVKGVSTCLLKFGGASALTSPLARLASNPVQFWQVRLAGTPAQVISVFVEMRGGVYQEVFKAVEEKFGERCDRPLCSFYVGLDQVLVSTKLGETSIILTSEDGRVLDAAEAAAARKEL